VIAMSEARSRIYFDNAATSWPKPDSVYDAVDHYQRENGAAFGRGAHDSATEVNRIVTRCRQRVAKLLGVKQPERVIFTLNATDSLNLAIHGLLKPGDHVVTTVLEHNSVSRPLRFREQHCGLEVTRVEPDSDGIVTLDRIQAACRDKTRLIAMIHASNVTGVVQPVEEVGAWAFSRNIRFLVDAAQSAGVIPISFDEARFSLLACAGHKGLLGPLGTGVLCLAQGMSDELLPVRQGGTGTESESDEQPAALPSRYESGNHNIPGLMGLDAGVGYLLERGIASIHSQEQTLIGRLREGLREISGITLYGSDDPEQRVGVVSLTSELYDPQSLSVLLSQEFGIETRAGLHCAPGVHNWLTTKEQGGTLRFSVGPFTTSVEIEQCLQAVQSVHG
jgi:cysteine desulfurase family protein